MTEEEQVKLLRYAALIEERQGDMNFLSPEQRKELSALIEKQQRENDEEEKRLHAS